MRQALSYLLQPVISTLINPSELFLPAVKLVSVVRLRMDVHPGARRLHVAAHHMQAVADDGPGESMAPYGHVGKDRPAVRRRVVRFERAESEHRDVILSLAAGDVDLPAPGARGHRAACARHARAWRPPCVCRRIVFLDDADVAAPA